MKTKATYIVRLHRPGTAASSDQFRTPKGWKHAPVLGRGFASRAYAETIAIALASCTLVPR